MMRTPLADRSRRLRAGDIARICRGRVLRAGEPARAVGTDTRHLRPGDCFVALRGERFDGHDYVLEALSRGAAGVVVDRAVPRRLLPEGAFAVRVADTTRALEALAAAHRQAADAKVVAITGSCGKTSTKEMLGTVLGEAMPTVRSPKSFNNRIGVPLSLFSIRPDTRAAVVEVGTNAPGEVEALGHIAAPDVAIVTCVAEAHLRGLGSLGGVAREKAGLLRCLRPGGLAILNGDDAACRAMAAELDARRVLVRVDGEADWFATDARAHGLGTTFLLQGVTPVTLPRLGTHNVYNALLTIAAAVELGMELDGVLEGLCRLPPVSRRLEPKTAGGVTVFDDTYNMNPASARAGLRALAGLQGSGRRVVVFGEMLELGERAEELHRELGHAVAESGVDLLLAVGPGAAPIADGAAEAGMAPAAIARSGDPVEAFERLHDIVRPGDRVLCKASRLVALDRVVDRLISWLGGEAAAGEPPERNEET